MKNVHLIIGTDGSAHNGKSGFGIHGFLGKDSGDKLVSGPPSNVLTTEGYMLRKDVVDEVKLLEAITYIDIYGRVGSSVNSNQAELDAMVAALNLVVSKLKEHQFKQVLVYSDSQYVVSGYNEYMHNWIKTEWKSIKGEIRPNVKQWMQLMDLHNELKDHEVPIKITWCKAHNGFIMNEKADVLAGGATNLQKPGIVRLLKEPLGYWRNTRERNPLLAFKHWLFMADEHGYQDNTYFLAEPGQDPYNIGKKTNRSGYSVVILKEPDPSMAIVSKAVIGAHGMDEHPLCTTYMDKVFQPELNRTIHEMGGLAFRQPNLMKRSFNLIHNRTSVVVEDDPKNMLMRGIEYMNDMEITLRAFMDGELENTRGLEEARIENITEYFAQPLKSGKGYTQSDTLKRSTRDIKIPKEAGSKKLSRSLFNSEMPNRFRLARLAGNGSKFFLLTWRPGTGSLKKNAIIIENDTGCAIYSNWFTNNLL